MFTLEDLEPALHKWAYHFQDNRFEHWELINEVWLRGNIQKVPHIKQVSQKIKWEMISYMREQSKYRLKGQRENRGELFPKMNNMSYFYRGDREDDELRFGEAIETIDWQKDYDIKDYFDFVLKGLTCEEKLIIKLRCFEDYTFPHIDKITGRRTANRVFTQAVEWISHRVKDMEQGRHVCKRYFPQTGQEKRRFWIEWNREKMNNFNRISEAKRYAKRKNQAC